MQIESSKIDNVLVVIPLEKQIDASSAIDFKEKMTEWINDGNNKIVLNLSHVDFVDSSGLGAILSNLKRLGTDGDLYVCCIKEAVMNLFKLTRMNRILKIFSSQDEAVKTLTAS